MADPKISVVIPTYNVEKYLPETIDSLRRQTANKKFWDVTFVDDGSTDRTQKIIKENVNSLENARYLINPKNMGQPYTRNRAIANSSGEYIALLDADDRFVPGTIESSLDFLADNPDARYIYSSMKIINDKGEFITEKQSLPFSQENLFHYNFISHVKIFSRATNNLIGGYNASVPFAQDWDHVLRTSLVLPEGSIKNNPDSLYEYRIHPGSISIVNFDERKKMICNFLENVLEQKKGRPVEVFWKEKVQRLGNNEYNYFDWKGKDE